MIKQLTARTIYLDHDEDVAVVGKTLDILASSLLPYSQLRLSRDKSDWAGCMILVSTGLHLCLDHICLLPKALLAGEVLRLQLMIFASLFPEDAEAIRVLRSTTELVVSPPESYNASLTEGSHDVGG